jgi:hypothetical protein
MPGNQRLAAGGRIKGRKDGNGRGFAGPVWTEQAENLALLDVERDAFDRRKITVFLSRG